MPVWASSRATSTRWCRIWVRRSINSGCLRASSASSSHCWRPPRRTSSCADADGVTAGHRPPAPVWLFAGSDAAGGEVVVGSAAGCCDVAAVWNVEPAVLGQEALVQGCVGFLVSERVRKVTDGRSGKEEHGHCGDAEGHADLELVHARKLECGAKR